MWQAALRLWTNYPRRGDAYVRTRFRLVRPRGACELAMPSASAGGTCSDVWEADLDVRLAGAFEFFLQYRDHPAWGRHVLGDAGPAGAHDAAHGPASRSSDGHAGAARAVAESGMCPSLLAMTAFAVALLACAPSRRVVLTLGTARVSQARP